MTSKLIRIKEELYNWLKTKYPKSSFSEGISRLIDENDKLNIRVNIPLANKRVIDAINSTQLNKPIQVANILKPMEVVSEPTEIKKVKWDKIDEMTEEEHLTNLKRCLSMKMLTQEEFDDQIKKHDDRNKQFFLELT